MRTATLLLIVCPLFAQTPLPDGASLDIVVVESMGEVDVRPSAKGEWAAASKGMKLGAGAKVCTGVGSSAAIAFGTNSVALLAECSVCEVRAFEMRGEELVASIHIDPGVAKVNVKQLALFHTDFQVSTPRLTCSVRGSTGLFVVNGGPDDQPDLVVNEEGHVSADDRDLSEGDRTNSDGESGYELENQENLADTTPEGSTEQETQDENLLSNTNQSLELDAGSLTTNTAGAPSGNDVSAEPPPEPQPPETTPRTQDLVMMAINGQDVTVHAADDVPGENEGETGVEGLERQTLLDLALNQGYPSFTQEFLRAIHDDFHNGTAQLEQQDPQLFAEHHDLFHDSLPETGFNALGTYLQAAGDQAAVGSVDPTTAVLILAALFHTDWHIIHANEPSAVFDPLHAEFHTDDFDPILQAVVDTALEDALAMWARLVHETWHDVTECSDFLDEGSICFTHHQHFEMRLLETGTNIRAATETLGVQTNEEELMLHAYLNHADVRHHSDNTNDLTTFQLRHDRMDFEHNALGVTGLGAGVRNFDVADEHEEFHDDPSGLQQTNQQLFDARHTDFHTSDTVFGLDGYKAYWTEVAEDGRSQTIDRFALSHALIAGLDVDFLRNNYALPAGNSPGQYDFERGQFLQNVIDPLHATADADQFAQFVHDYDTFLDNRWHQVTGIPQGVQSGQTGFEAHEHFHQSLNEFHAQTHAATGVPDP